MEGARRFEGTNGRGASGSSSVAHTRCGVTYTLRPRRFAACLVDDAGLACAP